MRRERDRRLGLALLIVLALCVGVTALHQRAVRQHQSDSVAGAVRDYALVPTQVALGRMRRWWQLSVVSWFSAPRIARENAALRAQNLTLSNQNTQLLAAQAENDRLRDRLGFERRSPRPLIAAEVAAIKPSPLADTLILNRGVHDGVHPRSVVLAPNGALLGQALEVSSRSCIVLMLTDSSSSVGAAVIHHASSATTADSKAAPPPVGICQGDMTGTLRLIDLNGNAEIQPGDTVVTSGLGGVFPKGLPLGTVQSVTDDKTRSLKSALLRPAADFNHLDEAFLLR